MFLVLTLAVIIAMLVAILGNEDEVFGINLAADPSSLSELSLYGGSSHESKTPAELTRSADFIVSGTVVDVHRSRLNTRDGSFPDADEIGVDGLAQLTVITDVDIRLDEMLLPAPAGMRRSDQAAQTADGEIVTITIIGGSIVTDLTKEQADAVGYLDVIEEDDGTITELAPSGPVREFWWGMAIDTELVEGEDVVMLVDMFDLPNFDGEGSERIATISHPDAAFVNEPAGGLSLAANRGVSVDEEIITSVISERSRGRNR